MAHQTQHNHQRMLAFLANSATTVNLNESLKKPENEVDVYLVRNTYSLPVLRMTRKDQRKEQMCLS